MRLPGRSERALPLYAGADPALPGQALRSLARPHRPASHGQPRNHPPGAPGERREQRRLRPAGGRGAGAPAGPPGLSERFPRSQVNAPKLCIDRSGPGLAGIRRRAHESLAARAAPRPQGRAHPGGPRRRQRHYSSAPGRSPAVPHRPLTSATPERPQRLDARLIAADADIAQLVIAQFEQLPAGPHPPPELLPAAFPGIARGHRVVPDAQELLLVQGQAYIANAVHLCFLLRTWRKPDGSANIITDSKNLDFLDTDTAETHLNGDFPNHLYWSTPKEHSTRNLS